MECKIFAVKDIRDNSKIVERMFSLMKKHYENMKKDKFLKDLYDKSNVFLLFENNEGSIIYMGVEKEIKKKHK